METYQAIYDAVRSRIQSCDIGEIVRNATHIDASHAIAIVQQELCIAAGEMQRPSAVYRPSLSMDGTKWCALYGADLMNGVAGFGDTAAAAMAEFDRNWHEQRTSEAVRRANTSTAEQK